MKCFHPQTFNDNVVSCGRCVACRQNRINGWVVRLEKHERHQQSAHFITLTYADGMATRTKNGLLTLDKSHLTQFFKRLRNLHNADYKKQCREAKFRKLPKPKRGQKITYYAAGEYGTKGSRPHYHIILFNANVNLVLAAWSTKIQSKWVPRGNIHTGDTHSGSIRYSLKYISKPSRIPLFQGDDRTPEFSNMSQGIGKAYITDAIKKWHLADLVNRYYVPGNGGVKTSMPRYYADKIYTKEQKQEIGIHLEMKTSDEFYKAMLKDTKFIDQFLYGQKYLEEKSFIIKPMKL